MNNCMFIGRLTKDLELKETQNGNKYVEFSLAIDNGKDKDGNKRPATFPNFRAWEQLAETCSKYLKKGSMVGIIGRYEIEKWQNEAGENRYNHVFLVNKMTFLDSKPKETHEPTAPDYLNKTDAEIVADVVNNEDPYAAFGQQVETESQELPF